MGKDLRRQWRLSGRSLVCVDCMGAWLKSPRPEYLRCDPPDQEAELHHYTYTNVGQPEELDDLVPLCRYHHAKEHGRV